MGRQKLRRQAKNFRNGKDHQGIKEYGISRINFLRRVKTTNSFHAEVANITGTKIHPEQWRKEQTEEIEKHVNRSAEWMGQILLLFQCRYIPESPGRLRGGAAAEHMLSHYSETCGGVRKNNIQTTYKELQRMEMELKLKIQILIKRWDSRMNWMEEYIGRYPILVYEKIWDNSRNIQSVCTQLAVIWELCEGVQLLEAQERRRKHVGQVYA